MLHLVVLPKVVDDFFTHLIAGPQSERGVECRHFVVLVLRPLLEWVIVTLGADHTHAEKDLGCFLHGRLWIASYTEEIRGWAFVRSATTRKQLACHLVVGLVGGDGLADPFVERVHAFFAQIFAVGLQQVAPLQCPMVHEGRTRNQLVDHAAALDFGVRGIR